MKENENKKNTVFVTDGSQNNPSDIVLESSLNKVNKFKKPLIFALMCIVFLGCMYLIFKPSGNSKVTEDIGLNDSVPQATDNGLQDDKQKAYEEAMLEQKNLEKQNALTSLSDYWKEDSTNENGQDVLEKSKVYDSSLNNDNPSLNSYRNAQNTVGTFYQTDNSETLQLRKELDELKEQLAKKNETPIDPVESQLELMEKSYQMAAKYLPTKAVSGEQPKEQKTALSGSSNQKESFVAFLPVYKNVVSSLQRVLSDSSFTAKWSENHNSGFYTVGKTEPQIQPKNSIRAVVQQTQLLTEESSVRLRLLEPAKIGTHIIPPGTVLTANSKFQQGRLQMEITSIELDGNIFPVDLMVYGLDGQQGLSIPYSSEMNALREMAANMGQTSGSGIMMTNSAGQQIAGDLSRGLVQSVSGYFSKKMRTPKVTLKAGHQVFLVSKK